MVALACQPPAATGVPLSRWTGPELAAELAARGLPGPISASSTLRILAAHPVRPWQYRSWIYPRAPDFEAKANVILDLYQGFYGGKPLRPGDRLLSTPSRRSRPAAAATRPPPASPYVSSTNTSATARSPCWPGSTCTPGKCSPPPRRPPGSSRS